MLTLTQDYLQERRAVYTASEIEGQSQLWKDVFDSFIKHTDAINAFFQEAYKEVDNIILTGAGTSAFIGLSLQGAFFRIQKLLRRLSQQLILFLIRRIILIINKQHSLYHLPGVVTAPKAVQRLNWLISFQTNVFILLSPAMKMVNWLNTIQ